MPKKTKQDLFGSSKLGLRDITKLDQRNDRSINRYISNVIVKSLEIAEGYMKTSRVFAGYDIYHQNVMSNLAVKVNKHIKKLYKADINGGAYLLLKTYINSTIKDAKKTPDNRKRLEKEAGCSLLIRSIFTNLEQPIELDFDVNEFLERLAERISEREFETFLSVMETGVADSKYLSEKFQCSRPMIYKYLGNAREEAKKLILE